MSQLRTVRRRHETSGRAREDYIEPIHVLFSNTRGTLEAVSGIVSDLIGHVSEVTKPCGRLMTLIQRQDIRRQSLENLIQSWTFLQTNRRNCLRRAAAST